MVQNKLLVYVHRAVITLQEPAPIPAHQQPVELAKPVVEPVDWRVGTEVQILDGFVPMEAPQMDFAGAAQTVNVFE